MTSGLILQTEEKLGVLLHEQFERKIQDWYMSEKGGLNMSTAECHKWFWQKFSLTIPEALGKKTTEINKLIERFENEIGK